MTMRSGLAALGIIVGGIGAILSLLIAFGVDITPDQHTAIVSVVSLLLLALGALLGQDQIVELRARREAEKTKTLKR